MEKIKVAPFSTKETTAGVSSLAKVLALGLPTIRRKGNGKSS